MVPMRIFRIGFVTLILMVVFPYPGYASSTRHGVIQPLAPAVVVDSVEFDPVSIGRTWLYRAPSAQRYRHRIVFWPTLATRPSQQNRRAREIRIVGGTGSERLLSRTIIDPRAVDGVLIVTDDQSDNPSLALAGPRILEMPRTLGADALWMTIANGVRVGARLVGLADVKLPLGAFRDCLVVEVPLLGQRDVVATERRFYARDVGMVLSTKITGADVESTTLELESWGADPQPE